MELIDNKGVAKHAKSKGVWKLLKTKGRRFEGVRRLGVLRGEEVGETQNIIARQYLLSTG